MLHVAANSFCDKTNFMHVQRLSVFQENQILDGDNGANVRHNEFGRFLSVGKEHSKFCKTFPCQRKDWSIIEQTIQDERLQTGLIIGPGG
jgi:hypothetical protein